MPGMALPLVHVDRLGLVDPRPSTSSLGRVTTLGGLLGLLGLVGRGLAIGFGVAVLIATGSGAASLAVIGVLAIGSALVSWSE